PARSTRKQTMWRFPGVLVGVLILCGAAIWWSRAEGRDSALDITAGRSESVRDGTFDRLPLVPPGAADATPMAAGTGQVPHDPILITACPLVPVQEQDVASQVDGVVREVLCELGTPVVRGQILGLL